jgi:hypothetical protein
LTLPFIDNFSRWHFHNRSAISNYQAGWEDWTSTGEVKHLVI